MQPKRKSDKVTPIARRLRSWSGEMVDELGRLDEKMKAFKKLEARQKQIRAEVLAWYDDKPADQAYILEGEAYAVTISERANSRTIKSMPKLFKRLGQKLFLELATFALKHVDEQIPVGERAKFLEEAQTGTRKLKCVAKLAVAA